MKYVPLIVLFVFSFNIYSAVGIRATVIKGKVLSPTQKLIQIEDLVITLDQSSSFEYKIQLMKPKFFKIKYQNLSFSLFVQPGEELKLTFDPSAFPQSVRYEGISATENKMLLRQEAISPAVNHFLNTEWVAIFSSQEDLFFNKIDSLKTLYLKPLDSLTKYNRKINATFVSLTRSDIHFSFDKLLLLYPQQFSRFTGKPYHSAGTIDSYLSKINLDESTNIDVEEYATFGRLWIDPKVREIALTKNTVKVNRWLNAAMEVISKEFKNDDVVDYWKFHYLKSHIENNGISELEENINSYLNSGASKEFKDQLNSIYATEKKNREKAITKIYKTIDGVKLNAFIFNPKDLKKGDKRPAMVYFHGGSWSEGKPDWQFGQSDDGFINICVEYRTFDRHGVLPFEEVSDAKSSLRWIRQNAEELKVDTSKIIVQGNSAGGHLALCAAMLDTLDELNEDKTVSSKPSAVILNAPVYDLSSWMWFDEYVKDKTNTISISPTHNVKSGLPPLLVFHGTNDGSVPFPTAVEFVAKMKSAGNKVEFYPVENASHELWFSDDYYKISGDAKAAFLKNLGCL